MSYYTPPALLSALGPITNDQLIRIAEELDP